MSVKDPQTDHPIQPVIAARWSPYAWDSRPVPESDLCSLFEAARWAPSCFNEQPWSYIVATQADPEAFARLLSCLVEANQEWARAVPVLALAVVSSKFAKNGNDNRTAAHDLGLASANLLVEATARGLHVHQMAGILPDRARELYAIPEGHEAWTGIAIGYLGDPRSLGERFRQRDLTPRSRKPLAQFVFGERWGSASPLVSKS